MNSTNLHKPDERIERLEARLEYLRGELEAENGSRTAELLLLPSIERLERQITTLEAESTEKRPRRKPARAFSGARSNSKTCQNRAS
jgi:hypothetical protein